MCRCGRQRGHPAESEQRAAAGERPHQVPKSTFLGVFTVSLVINSQHISQVSTCAPITIHRLIFAFAYGFRKLRDVLQQRVIRFLLDQSKKEPEKYSKFFEDYGLFMREGIVTTQEQDVKVTALGGKSYKKNNQLSIISLKMLQNVWRNMTPPPLLSLCRRTLQSCSGSSPPLCRRASRPI